MAGNHHSTRAQVAAVKPQVRASVGDQVEAGRSLVQPAHGLDLGQ